MLEWTTQLTRERLNALEVGMEALKAEVAELRAQRLDPEEPTIAGLPERVRVAIDDAIPSYAEDRTSLRVRQRLLRGARARLKAGWTDAGVAEWITQEGER